MVFSNRHSLAQQKSFDESAANSAPTTQHASPIPPTRPARSSLESSNHTHHYTTPPNGTSSASGSETNISTRLTDTSMRRQLLRRIWSKEFRQQDTRSGSWSPPLRRSQRRLHVEPPDKCQECTKLEKQYDSRTVSPQKRVRLNSSTLSMDDATLLPLSPCHLTEKSSSTTTISSTTTNRVTSSSDRPVLTTSGGTSSGPPEISSSLSEREVVRKNVFVYINSRDTSSADDNGADDSPSVLPVPHLAELRTEDNNNENENITPITNDSGNGYTTNVAESISNSRTDENDNEQVTGAKDVLNTPTTVEKNGNAIAVDQIKTPGAGDKEVDQYISNLLIDSLNNVIRISSTARAFRNNDNKTVNNVKSENKDNTTACDLNDNETISVTSIDDRQLLSTGGDLPIDNRGTFEGKYSETSTMALGAAEGNLDPVSEERRIYFPRYSAESKDNMSVFSTAYSEENDSFDSPECGEMIPVQTGSSYPSVEYHRPVIIPRLVHRTESMEAQPASTSPRENRPDSGGDSDDSLVDSLDDPSSPQEELLDDTADPPAPVDTEPPPEHSSEPVQYEKSQTFFIPIVDNNETIDERIDVATAMPDKLRERLMKRLQMLETKKQQVNTKKQKKLDKLIKRNRIDTDGETTSVPRKITTTTTTTTSTTSKSTSAQTEGTFNKSVASQFKAKKNKFLRTEIGLLESYTIDARGNLQFKPQTKETNNHNNMVTSGTTTTSSSTSVKKTTAPTNSTRKSQQQSRKGDIITIKRSQTKKSTVNSTQRRKEIIKDVQHMTLYQSDMITPDTDCGPRRVYQKTEIHDGEKRIEILEIVECIDSCSSSPEDNSELLSSYRTRSAAIMHKSRIPVPVYRMVAPKSVKVGSRDNSPGRIFVKNIQQLSASGSGGANNTKVDQMIADLLIEALNHPRELGIEFVKSPKDFSRSSKSSGTPGSAGSKRSPMSRRSNAASSGTSRRSGSGTKYQQVFEVIPEEKGSISVDSSNEEGGRTKTSTKSTTTTISGSDDKSEATNPSQQPVNRMARGKEAVENDISTESDAWIGFFRQHDDTEGTTILLFA